MNWQNIKIIKFENEKHVIRRGYFGFYGYFGRNGDYWWSFDNKQHATISNKRATYDHYQLALHGPKGPDKGKDVTKDFKVEVAEERLCGE